MMAIGLEKSRTTPGPRARSAQHSSAPPADATPATTGPAPGWITPTWIRIELTDRPRMMMSRQFHPTTVAYCRMMAKPKPRVPNWGLVVAIVSMPYLVAAGTVAATTRNMPIIPPPKSTAVPRPASRKKPTAAPMGNSQVAIVAVRPTAMRVPNPQVRSLRGSGSPLLWTRSMACWVASPRDLMFGPNRGRAARWQHRRWREGSSPWSGDPGRTHRPAAPARATAPRRRDLRGCRPVPSGPPCPMMRTTVMCGL